MTVVEPVGAVGNAFSAFSKDPWARSSASIGPAASTGRWSRRRLSAARRIGGRLTRLLLELDRRQVVEGGMSARRVVPAFDELEDRGLSLGRAPQPDAVQQLALERREEALAHRVVVAVADRAHRRPHVRLATAAAELDRRVLTAVV